MNEEPRNRDQEHQEETPASSPRNPFAEDQSGEPEGPDDHDALVQTKRSAALLGVIVGFGVLILVVLICVVGSYAFAG